MANVELSHVTGATESPLLELTVGEALRDAAARYGASDSIVSVFQCQRLTYAELDRDADRVAGALIAMGIRKGDRIAIWSANKIEWLVAHHGAVRVGAVVVTVNPALRQEEARHVLADSGSRLVFAARAFRGYSFVSALDNMRSDLSELEEIIYFDFDDSGSDWFEFLNRSPQNRKRVEEAEGRVSPDDPCSLQYTSGTTGRPKGALLTHRNILNNGHFVGERQKLTSADRICLPVPFFHCFGLVLGALAAMTHGSAIVLPGDSFDPESTFDTIRRERCTSFYGVPTMYISLLTHEAVHQADFSTLRTGCMGGAPCPIETMRQAVECMNMREITVTYGMTETSPISFQTLPDDSNERRVTTVGTVHPHIEARIIDPQTGQTVERGVSGELCIRGYSVMLCYWRNPASTSEAIDKDGWMHTGDLATMTSDGYLQIVGRSKNTIIRGGENIYPREIEEFLLTMPEVAEAYVFGLPDAKYGEEVCSWIKLKAGANMTAEQLKARCKGRIATFKIPRYVRLVDAFPTTASGKVQYFRMREAELELTRPAKGPDPIAC
ncbi:AMP-binding protein [Bradyrhizobium sp. INPA03-11B]|uniref:AMP-binding protein n=1 Tax=Bradyrhizobium sp. INPA03-11B TaxID=418598 RepID=UPI00338D4B79